LEQFNLVLMYTRHGAEPAGHSILPPRRAPGALQIAVLVHTDQVTFQTL
jgi:hypothetical protein